MKDIKLLILTDEFGFFTRSLKRKNKTNSVETEEISIYLKAYYKNSIVIEQKTFRQLDFLKSYTDWYVLYASSDDYGLFYKDYIEDILLRLQEDGAILIPNFNLFRAHHNKSYMELYKTTFLPKEYNPIQTEVFSCYAAFKEWLKNNGFEYPVVVKASSGAGSSGVGLALNRKELLKVAKKVSYRKYRDYYVNWYRTACMQKIKNFYRKQRGEKQVFYKPMQGKFVVQSFVKRLENDYKVLVFGEKYYVLKRLNRKNDFRASGSGKFEFVQDIDLLKDVLDYARGIYEILHVPVASLDIAFDGQKNYLIEYQCVNFGPYTLEYSPCYYLRRENVWTICVQESKLESEYANGIIYYFQKEARE